MIKPNFLLIILLGFSTIANAQFQMKVNLEGGYHFNLGDSIINKTNSIYRLSGILKYKTRNKNTVTKLLLKIRPEIFNNELGSFKINPQGTFFYFTGNTIWKSFLSVQHNEYFLNNKNSSYDTFVFINGAQFKLTNSFPVDISIGYSYQNINFGSSVNSDFLFLSGFAKNRIDNFFVWSYGLFIQNFTTKTEIARGKKNIKSSGLMYGPQIKLHYLKKFILDAEYKFLLENSNFISYPSFEHQINLLAGFMFNKKISFFLMADLYIRRIILKKKTPESDPVFYTPTQNENQLFFKASYKFIKNTSVYFKTGYFNENIFLDNFNIEGINFFIGFEYKP